MPILLRMDMRIWWLTVSKAADRSSKMSTEDLEAALASLRAFVKSSQVTFIYIALLTIQIVTKQLHNIKMGK